MIALSSALAPLDSSGVACAALVVAGSLGLLLLRQPGKKPVAQEPEPIPKRRPDTPEASAATDEAGREPEHPPVLVSPPTTPEEEETGREEPEKVERVELEATTAPSKSGEFAAGTRVEIHSLQKAAALNGSYGVVLRCEAGRFALRKELTLAGDSTNVSVKASNLRVAPAHDLVSLQALVDAAPNGARVTLPRGTIAAGGADEVAEDGAPPPTLELKTAIALTGMGNRTGGTIFGFSVCLDPELEGEELELSNFHINGGTLDVSPMDLQRLRLTRVSVTAPPGATKPAVLLDEIGLCSPGEEAALEGMRGKAPRVLLEECWTRGGKVGVMVNVVGCTLRGCRLQGARTFGVHANATFALEGCTIGQCRAGGISARKEVEELRVNGCNENRVQRDPNDTQYSGYDRKAHGCVGTCTCAAITMFAGYGDPLVRWDDKGGGQWRKLGM